MENRQGNRSKIQGSRIRNLQIEIMDFPESQSPVLKVGKGLSMKRHSFARSHSSNFLKGNF